MVKPQSAQKQGYYDRCIITTFVACIWFLLTPALLGAAPKERKPNIVLIMADDVGWECFGCYGAQDYKTPHIDRLAREGIRFEHCYSTPICTPTRVKLMTGKYNFRNYTHFGYLHPEERTFGHMLQEVGYKTAIAGKWQLNGLYNKLPGWDDPRRPLKTGFNESLLWQVTTGRGGKDGGGERFWNPPLEHNGRFVTKEENRGKYGPGLFTDFVCDFMERNQDDPFFVYYPMVLVHEPFVPTPDTIGDIPLDKANKQPKDYEGRKANFVAMVQYMDKLVGRIVAKIDSLGLSEHTIVMFTADNGTHPWIRSMWRGIEIQGGKGGMTDRGTHVPFVASWPGHTPRGTVLRDLIEFTDFYPTLADAAGITLTQQDPIDGISFLPQLRGQQGSLREWVFCHYQPYWNKTPGQFIRNAGYKLYADGRFYCIAEDLFERQDLANSTKPKTLAMRKQLQSRLDRCPPAPIEKGTAKTEHRPVYPDWRNLLE